MKVRCTFVTLVSVQREDARLWLRIKEAQASARISGGCRYRNRMNQVDYIKGEIQRLYETAPNIHISVRLPRSKLAANGAPAVITGVYRNIFRIEESECGYKRSHSFQYTDVLIGQVEIEELTYVPMTSILNKK